MTVISRPVSAASLASSTFHARIRYPFDPVVSETRSPPRPGTLCRASTTATTVIPMRLRQARGQLWAFVYLAVRRMFDLFLLTFRSEHSKEVELLALRHEVEVLRRQVGRCAYEPADRALLAIF